MKQKAKNVLMQKKIISYFLTFLISERSSGIAIWQASRVYKGAHQTSFDQKVYFLRLPRALLRCYKRWKNVISVSKSGTIVRAVNRMPLRLEAEFNSVATLPS